MKRDRLFEDINCYYKLTPNIPIEATADTDTGSIRCGHAEARSRSLRWRRMTASTTLIIKREAQRAETLMTEHISFA
jgi:hypothetical protein